MAGDRMWRVELLELAQYLSVFALGGAPRHPGLGKIAEGDLDFRGTLAVDRDAPVGFREIRLRFDLPSVPEQEREALLKLTERYCVVYQTLAAGPTLTTTLTAA